MLLILLASWSALAWSAPVRPSLKPGAWDVSVIFGPKKPGKKPWVRPACLTEKMLKDGVIASAKRAHPRCTPVLKSQTAAKTVAEFKCKDGMKGTAVFHTSGTRAHGRVEITAKSGAKSELNLEGRYRGPKCAKK